MHVDPAWVTAALAVFSALLIPAVVILTRGTMKWSKTEFQLATLIESVKDLIVDKEKMHAELMEQMRTDREVTDRRLRYLEEFWMEQGRRAATKP